MMNNFRFLFCLYPGRAASEADRQPRSRLARFIQEVVKTLLKDRTDTSFSLFWARILQGKTTKIQTIEDPKLPRKRKSLVRHEFGKQATTLLKLPKTITNESIL